MIEQNGFSISELRRRPVAALTGLLGVLLIVIAIALPALWTDSYPVRIFSASMTVAGAGVLVFGLSVSTFLKSGTRAKEFTFIGCGGIGMAMMVIGALTLVEIYRPV
ncbi:hypothetical protein [Arthrobacter sp. B2a2-09]|uniref:hypothetical protein n=1 Tax=Arthrobacter sp. B2a2-09 TaxID=2952822 RepID=UPI0022CD2F3C|nr:hypothetical protein [Arthrobacter sp. B2a2-09]MCZ9884696.1 hypothetical protein [Arthrobacter sp. B2a2-09]